MGSKLLKVISHQYFVRFCKQSKKLTIENHTFDHVICFMTQHGILIEPSFSVKIQLKTPSDTLVVSKHTRNLMAKNNIPCHCNAEAALYVLGKRENQKQTDDGRIIALRNQTKQYS